jgi:hypothetical protein
MSIDHRDNPPMADEQLGIGKVCPHCGARTDTLGSICRACGKPYERGGLLDRLPFMDGGLAFSTQSASAWFLVAVLLLAGWVWLLISHPVAAILVTAGAFVLLVAAIGVTNALADRGR